MHPSHSPKCLHGYAVSARGARRLRLQLTDPWSAYQMAVDTAIPARITNGTLNTFSVVPAVIIQTKDVASAIQKGIGSPWRGILTDSTFARIRLDESRISGIPDEFADFKTAPGPVDDKVWEDAIYPAGVGRSMDPAIAHSAFDGVYSSGIKDPHEIGRIRGKAAEAILNRFADTTGLERD